MLLIRGSIDGCGFGVKQSERSALNNQSLICACWLQRFGGVSTPAVVVGVENGVDGAWCLAAAAVVLEVYFAGANVKGLSWLDFAGCPLPHPYGQSRYLIAQ